ncbi:MAG: hypothetical protein RJA70_1896 [Pseudomonadota bacterium]|jgi:hypothetical protein
MRAYLLKRRSSLKRSEGFNNKARITTRKAYGFRSYEPVRIALFHSLGDLTTPLGSPTNFSEEAHWGFPADP